MYSHIQVVACSVIWCNLYVANYCIMFSTPSTFGSSTTGFGGFGNTTTTSATANPMKDYEVR